MISNELMAQLRNITVEEAAILNGKIAIQKELYSDKDEFIIDSARLLKKGQLIKLRPHTRFAHFPKHRHNYVEMVYMCSGETTHIINDKERIILKEGDLLFLNQYVYQEILPAGENDIAINFIILPEFLNRPLSMIEKENVLRDFLFSALSKNSPLTSYLHFNAKEILPVQNLIENMIWSLLNKKNATNAIIQTTMGLLLMNLSAFSSNINQSNPNQYEQSLIFLVLRYIEEHYKSGSLLEISASLNQPDYYISRLLKKHTGHNFKELLQQRKLQQASYLLTNTSLSIESVLDEIGYNNSSFFYRVFKERYNVSPNEYRKKASI